MPRKSKHSLSILHQLAGRKLFLKVAGVFTFTNSWSNTASAAKSGATFPTRGSENSRDCSTAQKQRNKSGMRDKITHIRKLTELLQTLQHWSQFLVTVPFFSCIQQKPRSLRYMVEGPFWCHFKFPWTFRWNQWIWEDMQRVQASISSLLNRLLTSLVLWKVDMEKNPTTTLWRANSLQIDKNECGPWPWEYHPQSITP